MVSSAATTVAQYLSALPVERRASIERVRDTVRANLPAGYEEGMVYGMIGWYVPLSRFPDTYNGHPLCIASLASQKQYMALYLMGVYGDPELERAFRAGFAAAGKKLDMGKSCVRFTSADALALDVIGETIAKVPVDRYLAVYAKARAGTATARAKTKTKTKAKKAPPKTKKAKPKAKIKARAKTRR